jgi:SAM-dependent methyltransferase
LTGIGGDKAENGYLPAYLRIASELGTAARVCEIGVQSGTSLELWQVLFPSGEVTGVDIDPEAVWPEGTRRVIADQEDPQLPEILGGPFDLIVDDAGHHGGPTQRTFENLWPLVAPGGYYVIEDWWTGFPEVISRYTERNTFYIRYLGNSSMLQTVQDLLLMLDEHDSEADEVTYRFGMAVVHRRKT